MDFLIAKLAASWPIKISCGQRLKQMIPTLVDENGQVKLVVGASGGPRIITGITYVRL